MAKQKHPHSDGFRVLREIEKDIIACQTKPLEAGRIIEYLLLVGRYNGCIETLHAQSELTTGDIFAKNESIAAVINDPGSIISLIIRALNADDKAEGIQEAILKASTASLLIVVASNLRQMRTLIKPQSTEKLVRSSK
ncbi:MAG: hypothetical protein WAZ27_05095 [Minisyncoccia bacterium]